MIHSSDKRIVSKRDLPFFYFNRLITVLIIIISAFANLSCKEKDSAIAKGKKFSIATDHPLASQAGLAMLEKGGNVVDAFVASSLAIAVVRPQSTGLGGGGFALVHFRKSPAKNSQPTPKYPFTKGYDFRERAPLLAHTKMYLDEKGIPIPEKSLFGYASVAVPGLVKGLYDIHLEYGNLDWKDCVEPAIRLAEDGFPVYDSLREAMEKAKDHMNPAMRDIFLKDNLPWKEGDIFVQKDLAKTLRIIQEHGSDGFYKGETAIRIHKSMEENKGYLRLRDMEKYSVKKVDPIYTTYRGYKIESFPLPSSAIFMFQILKLLEPFDLKKLHNEDPHFFSGVIVESMSEAFQDRALLGGDAAFQNLPGERILGDKTIEEKLKRIKSKLSQPTKAPTQQEKMSPSMESYNTTHITVMDAFGNIATSTHSVNYTLGSRVVIPGTGIVMNDTMDDFSILTNVPNAYGLVGSSANSIQPGKTPLSSMSPTIVYKSDKPWFSLGAPGGSFIFTSILNTIIRRIDLEESPLDSVKNPRIHYQWKPNIVFMEKGWKGAETLGSHYNTKIMESKAKVFYAELDEDNSVIAVSDPRGQGVPLAK